MQGSRQVLSIPKRDRAAAVGLWTLAGAWSARELTDGYVPEFMLTELSGTPRLAGLLVDCGLWDQLDAGFIFRQWSKYNPTADQVRSDREAARERMRRRRRESDGKYAETGPAEDRRGTGGGPAKDRRGSTVSAGEQPIPYDESDGGRDDSATTSEDGEMFARTESEHDANFAESSDSVRPPRPDPTRPIKKESGSPAGSPAPRATRIPEDWKPTPELMEWARSKYPGVDLDTESEKFVDYWLSKGGKESRKVYWDRTWRNWIRSSRAATNPPVKERRRFQEI
ncbi:hypothetical protein PBI_HUFFY_53 [Gordonia phage Huffy]|nr:hypothetical protein PBI_HUFFY_53 [Gordonia phage Huffy]AQY55737.1 hypothetical protein PBI_DINODARYN_53 [Gordonia phage DinoDaryn]